jgi:hypothetical protein
MKLALGSLIAAMLGACAANVDVADSGDQFAPDTGGPGAKAVAASLIKVTWRPNSEADLAGYRVYRDGKLLATVQRIPTTYADRAVLPATTYAYNLSAFDGAGNESGLSATYRATTPPGAMSRLSFANDVFPILQAQCSSCHVGYANVSTAYTLATAVGTGPCEGRRITIVGNAPASLLYQKITASQDCGEAPPGGALPSEQARIIGAWINQGALNN